MSTPLSSFTPLAKLVVQWFGSCAMRPTLYSANHCFAFEQDFVGTWRCIPLCVRRKLDLMGLKLKLSHWLELSQAQRQELVDWSDAPDELEQCRETLRSLTRRMADGMAKDLAPAVDAPWQEADSMPIEVAHAAQARGVLLTAAQWADLSELDRFCLCKLVRPGHDHHNLAAAFSEVLG
jgi:hypothetical protein